MSRKAEVENAMWRVRSDGAGFMRSPAAERPVLDTYDSTRKHGREALSGPARAVSSRWAGTSHLALSFLLPRLTPTWSDV